MQAHIAALIADVKALDARATPGPWHDRDSETENGYSTSAISPDSADEDGLSPADLSLVGRTIADGLSAHDAALIAHYRTAAPLLAAEVRRLRAELEEARRERLQVGLRAGFDVGALEAERNELRLTLAAEQGRQEGAPKGWEWTGGMWRRNGYPHAVTARHYGPTNLDLPWQWEVWDTRPALDVRLLGKGFAANARAAMLAADAVKP